MESAANRDDESALSSIPMGIPRRIVNGYYKPSKMPIHHNNWGKAEKKRLERLVKNNCYFIADGTIRVSIFENDIFSDTCFSDIDHAIRGQQELIDNCELQLYNPKCDRDEVAAKKNKAIIRRDVLIKEKILIDQDVHRATDNLNEIARKRLVYGSETFMHHLKEAKEALNYIWVRPYLLSAKRCLAFLNHQSFGLHAETLILEALAVLTNEEQTGIYMY